MRFLSFFLLLTLPVFAQAQQGCTDPLASNFNASATVNDGSCVYSPASVSPYNIKALSDTVSETSGLLLLQNRLWTHNDNTDVQLYGLDTATGQIMDIKTVTNAPNTDWEEIADDSNYVYIGDFGNNVSGNRTDLHIVRIPKSGWTGSLLPADTIRFVYSDQSNFTNTGNNNTDYDCETFIVSGDSLYLFTKQWVSRKTNVYALSKHPSGTVDTARLRGTLDVNGLVTGATYLPAKRALVLCGYHATLSEPNPFVFLLYDFSANNFFSGNKRKIDVIQPWSQVEGIATADGRSFFLSSETVSLTSAPARLQKIDLSPFLGSYYQTGIPTLNTAWSASVSPNPSSNRVIVTIYAEAPAFAELILTGMQGNRVLAQKINIHSGKNEFTISGAGLSGNYLLTITDGSARHSQKLVFYP